ncbi:HNH endonuclease [Aureibacillus halotolerans]|nr:HNH endonuclease [Aureibacillus halotolerans]
MVEVYNDVRILLGRHSPTSFNDSLLAQSDAIFPEDEQDEEASYQDTIYEKLDEGSTVPADKKKKAPPATLISSGKTVYGRDATIAGKALRQANFACEVDPHHHTFISKSKQRPYVEAHHLVLLSRQGEYDFALDQPANIVALCPNCHRLLHHGTPQERNVLLQRLFDQRQQRLHVIGIDITYDKLTKMYDSQRSDDLNFTELDL